MPLTMRSRSYRRPTALARILATGRSRSHSTTSTSCRAKCPRRRSVLDCDAARRDRPTISSEPGVERGRSDRQHPWWRSAGVGSWIDLLRRATARVDQGDAVGAAQHRAERFLRCSAMGVLAPLPGLGIGDHRGGDGAATGCEGGTAGKGHGDDATPARVLYYPACLSPALKVCISCIRIPRKSPALYR